MSIAAILNRGDNFRCADRLLLRGRSAELSVVVGLTEYPGTGSADIFLSVLYAEAAHTYDEIHKAVYIIICALVRVFCVGGYFTQAVYYAVVEALVVPERQIKKVYLTVFGRYRYKFRVKDDVLHIEAAAFCDLQYIKQI